MVTSNERSRFNDLFSVKNQKQTDKIDARIILKVIDMNLTYLLNNNVPSSNLVGHSNCNVKIFDCIIFFKKEGVNRLLRHGFR